MANPIKSGQDGQQTTQSVETTQSQPNGKSSSKKSVITKVRSSDRLLALTSLILLIIIFAIGVGAFFFIRDVVLDNDDDNEADTEQANDDEDSDSDVEDEAEDVFGDIVGSNDDENTSEESSEEPEETEEESEDDSDNNDEDNSDEDTSDNDSIVGESTSTSSESTDENSDDENVVAEDSNDDEDQDDNDDSDEDTDNNDDQDISATNTDTTSAGHSQSGMQKSVANANQILATKIWKATDYSFGDIKDSNYTVQLGDTLWEIADGFYGNPFNWTSIRDTNSASIGYLADGSQALILPGQVLALP